MYILTNKIKKLVNAKNAIFVYKRSQSFFSVSTSKFGAIPYWARINGFLFFHFNKVALVYQKLYYFQMISTNKL